MFEDDPKEPKDQPDEVELDEDEDEDAPEEEESAETEAEPEDEAEPEGDEDQQEEAPADEDDDLPSDPKVLKRMLRQQQTLLERTHGIAEQALRRQPPTDEEQPDEMAATFDELAKRDPAAAKLVAHLASKVQQLEGQVDRRARDTEAMARVPAKHQAHVKAIKEKFGLPTVVAHQIYKGALYDQAVARKQAKKAKPEAPPAEHAERRPQGKAPLTRPVRKVPDANGAGLIVVEGLKLKPRYKPGEYATMMDALPPAKRKVVLALRSEGKISVG